MKLTYRSIALVSGLALAAFAATARAQSILTGGFFHEPAPGTILVPTPDPRWLQVVDGTGTGRSSVSVSCASSSGSRVAFHLNNLLGPSPIASREIKIKPRGWDGTVKGSCRLSSNPAGEVSGECDLSDLPGPVTWRCFDSSGALLATGVSGSPVVPFACDFVVSPGALVQCVAIKTKGTGADPNRVIRLDLRSPGLTVAVTVPGSPPALSVAAIEFEQVTPDFSLHHTACGGIDIEADGIPDILVGNAASSSLIDPCRPPYLCDFVSNDVSIYGLGQASIADVCAGLPENCDDLDSSSYATTRHLHVSNIGSSGQDGVTIDVAGNPSRLPEIQISAKHTKTGHVTLLKRGDSSAASRGTLTHSSNPATGFHTFDCDFSSLSPTSVSVELHHQGVLVDTAVVPGGTASFSSIRPPVGDAIFRCGPGGGGGGGGGSGGSEYFAVHAEMDVIGSGGSIVRCDTVHFRALGVVAGVHIKSVTLTARRCAGIDVSLVQPPQCVSDVDDGTGTGTPDGGTGIEDLLYYLLRFEAGC